MKKVIFVLGVVMLISSGYVWASGLAIPEQGAAAMGMSAAMAARSEDLSSIFYNPAGIDYVERFEVYAGITPIMPGHDYSPFREDDKYFSGKGAESQVFLPPQLYAAFRAHEKVVLGLGVYAPFGLGTDWGEEWDGRYTSTFAEIQTIYVNPTVAFTVSKIVSIGLGVSYITSNATIEKMIDTGGKLNPNLAGNADYDSKFGLDGDGSGFGYDIGVIIRPIERVQLGISYRGAYDIEYEGDAKFTHSSALVPGLNVPVNQIPQIAGGMPASQTGTATMHMPWMLNLGAKFDISEVWDTSFDVDIVGWSVYDELAIDFDKNLPADKLVQEKDWENSFILRAGTSYDVSESFIARGGVLFDKNPVPDDTFDGQLPDANRYGISIGAGYKFGSVRIDASYLLLNFFKREKDNGVGFDTDTTGDGKINRFDIPTGYPVGNGKYKSRANLFSVSASYAF